MYMKARRMEREDDLPGEAFEVASVTSSEEDLSVCRRRRLETKATSVAEVATQPQPLPPVHVLLILAARDYLLTPFFQGFALGMLGHFYTMMRVKQPLRSVARSFQEFAKRILFKHPEQS